MTFQKHIYSHTHVYTSTKRFWKNMHSNRIWTRYIVHTNHQLNHCAASVNTLVLFLSLISTIHKSLCPARPLRHLAAAGVGYPARAQPRATRFSGHLESPGPDLEFLVQAPVGIQARAFQVLKLIGLARAVPPASDCAPVDRLQLDSWQVEVRTVVWRGHSGPAWPGHCQLTWTGTVIASCGPGHQCTGQPANSESDCWARKREP
jgi:hypothetical protein